MQISGIQKTTLLDYPGKVATIIFTLGCNFRCHYCHNFQFVLPEHTKVVANDLITEEAFFNFLKSREGLLDGVVISGGEPTLQGDLYDFSKKIKDLGFLVKIDTNGRDPKLIRKMIDDGIIDYVAMDIKNPIEKYNEIINVDFNKKDILETISLLLEGRIDYEFRSTVAKGVHTETDIEEMAKLISGAKRYFLQNYRPEIKLNEDFIAESFIASELLNMKRAAEKFVDKCDVRM
ncbi:MAG: anaerobic ribonucleoside-triphosphate reductase activating protein [Candidatus Gracilibacteria bacterium]|nr:anaerobic ribonucleoside-triphosphate reductase activating protein [Candidatus Gracilibacteria bacterium]